MNYAVIAIMDHPRLQCKAATVSFALRCLACHWEEAVALSIALHLPSFQV
jgi:hypothetical protein